MNKEGVAYILQFKDEPLPDFILEIHPENQEIDELQRIIK